MQIDEDACDAYARGCGVLGSGGGGETRTGLLMLRQAIADHRPVSVVQLADLDDDDLIMPCGLIGAPTVSMEKLPADGEGPRLVERAEALLGRPVAALMCMEIGGGNGLVPAAWAASSGRPLLDADGMGRAFPLLTQTAMALTGVPVAPLLLTDERGYLVTLEGPMTAEWAERLARSTAVAFGGRACQALHLMSAKTARNATIAGSVSRALRLGSALGDPRTDPFATLKDVVGATSLLRARVIDIDRVTMDGFMRGSTLLEGVGPDTGRLVRVEFQNENLVVLEDGDLLTSTPDLISLLDATTGEAVATEELHYGVRVIVTSIPADPIWRTPEGLALVGPAAFGYEVSRAPMGAM